MRRLTLVLGGARSGKSRYAEGLAARARGAKHYIATAEAFDPEMAERIARHRQQRGDGWETHEAPLDPVAVLAKCGGAFVLIDCVTVWLGNLTHHGLDLEAAVGGLCAALASASGRIVLVSNEVGLGLVPDTAMGRAFRDIQGRANQRLAEAADEVIFIAAGLPLVLKSPARRTGRRGRAASGPGGRG